MNPLVPMFLSLLSWAVNLTESGSMPVDDDIVGRIGDHKIGFCAVHEALVAGCEERSDRPRGGACDARPGGGPGDDACG
jgi:hypothetical protein